MYSCLFLILFAIFNSSFGAPYPSVFQRNGLQREQESVWPREPFEPQSPFQLPSNTNIQIGTNTIVVPPTLDIQEVTTYIKNENYEIGRKIHNHFESLNKDALFGLLIENHIPFYVKTVVDPPKPVQSKIHVMRIPKKTETTTPLPKLDSNLVEVVSLNSSELTESPEHDQGIIQINTDEGYQETLQKIVKTIESKPEDNLLHQQSTTTERDTIKTIVKKESEEQLQNDEPQKDEIPSSTVVYQHQVIYTPERKEDSKSIWDHIGTAYDKAKEKTSQFVVKAKDKTGELLEKARDKAKDVLDSDESKNKEPEAVNPADDI